MSDLLSIGRSGVNAYRGALAAVGENVTNSDTVGFARRSVTLKEQSAAGSGYTLYSTPTTFGGVQATGVTRVWDQYKAADAWSSSSDASRSSTRARYATTVESMIEDSDVGVGTRLTQLFTTASNLAANPSDTTLRQTMLSAAGEAASALNQTAANLTKVAGTIRTEATTLTSQANDSLSALARINLGLHSTGQSTAARAQLEDQRDALISGLAGSIGIDVTLDSQGAASVRLNDTMGPVLLKASETNPNYLLLQVASDGRLSTSVADNDGSSSAASPTGGTLAGLIDASATVAGRGQQLDGLAGRFATAMNDWQARGIDGYAQNGTALYSGDSAATIALALNDPAGIAAGLNTTDNGNLLALSDLRGQDGVEAGWRQLVTDQALKTAAAKTESSAASARKDGAYSALDEVSGVDLDTEAAELLRFQQAYSASAKIIQTARETLQNILDLF